MHIKEVILEGFKSYAQRTVVSGFDPHFNAITGLNGSGKSNILDAICFVLGIQNLSLVRVTNLQGLVYKKGQAGIKKASVTIIFNNEDKKTSPAAYEQFAEVTVTRQVTAAKDGKNKYLINGHNAQRNNVKNLFHSIGLNVNNPHFLIMQGRITKIVKMKPPEILGLLEEAAGTKMFEMKKEDALKTLGKKQPKVDEYQSVIAEEIAPKLEKLSQEQKNYIQWTSNNKEIELLSRFNVAYQYTRSETLLKESDSKVQEKVVQIECIQKEKEALEGKHEEIREQIKKLTAKKDSGADSSLQELEREVNDVSKELVKKNSEWAHAKDALAQEKRNQENIARSIEETESTLSKNEKELDDLQSHCTKLDEAAEAANQKLAERKRQFQAALAGAATEGDDENAKSWADQMMEAKQAVTSTATEQKRLAMKIHHLENEIPMKTAELEAMGQTSTKLQQEYDTVTSQVTTLKEKIATIPFNDEKESALLSERRNLEGQIRQLSEQADNLSARLSRLHFTYSDPQPHFDRNKVKGLMAKLIEVKNPQRDAVALEVTAGSRLYNIVVDSDDTATKLVDKGRLQRRVTIIPLNKISAYQISNSNMREAQRIAGGSDKATLALSLVGSAEDVRKAAEYVFGSTIVCPSMDIAQMVAKGVRARCVTLEGEVYETGTLTGGSRSQQQPILRQLSQLNDVRATIDTRTKRLQEITNELRYSVSYNDIKQKLSIKTHEANLLLQRLSSTASHQVSTKLQQMKEELVVSKEGLVACAAKEKEAKNKVKQLDSQSSSAESQHDARINQLEHSIAEAKKEANSATGKQKKGSKKAEMLSLEYTEQKKDLVSLRTQYNAIQQQVDTLQQQVDEMESVVASTNESLAGQKEKLEAQRQNIQKANKDIQNLVKEQQQAEKKSDGLTLDIKKGEHLIAKMKKDRKEAELSITKMHAQFPWIATEKQFFGQGEYDMSRQNPGEVQKKLASLEMTQAKLSKTINRKVMNMFESAKKEYDDLKEKIETLTINKSTIQSFIAELDERKKETLLLTWKQVNVDFASIFSTLLPGWVAKLEPPEGKTLTDGLRILFARGGVWKQSLSELSGGQRSLLALSLILALLRVKPAPVYILDEVDSALDLSNTQNIGKMLKTHFSQSQFVVVSLKEGMWNNANVLFRTKFVDGISQVSREKRGSF